MTISDDTPSPSNVDPSDCVRPRIALARISTTFNGDPLDKTVGNWKVWSSKMKDHLAICGLGGHIKEKRSIPDPAIYPVANENWKTNDAMARAYIRINCATIESELLDDIDSAYACFKALETYHLDVKQVNLIQNALAQRVARDKDQVANCRKIREDIRRAFHMPGGITEDTFVTITLLIVLGNGHEHIRAIFQQDMQAATEATPFKSDRILAYLEQDLQLLLIDEQRTGAIDSAIALAAKSNLKRGNARSTSHGSNCKRIGHICI